MDKVEGFDLLWNAALSIVNGGSRIELAEEMHALAEVIVDERGIIDEQGELMPIEFEGGGFMVTWIDENGNVCAGKRRLH